MVNKDKQDEETENEDGENLEKESSGKGAKKFFLLIILTVVMLLVIGGVTAAYFTGLLDPVIAWATKNENEEGVNISGEQEGEKIKILINLDPLAIPVFQGNSVAATAQIKVKLETNDEKKAEYIRNILPVITDALIRDLHDFLPRLLKSKKKIDYVIIRQRMKLIVDKVAGKDTVSNVIAQSLNEQPK
jgi:flagellar FliL protein